MNQRANNRSRYRPLLLLGAGASAPFGVPTMVDFLESEWGRWDHDFVAASLAIRRSRELHDDQIDLEEVMFLLDKLAAMSLEDPLATFFLKEVQHKYSQLHQLFEFDQIKSEARDVREQLRRVIYEKCVNFEEEKAWGLYRSLITAMYAFTKAERMYVATTNYDRIIESLWEQHPESLHESSPAFELQKGFYFPSYGQPLLDVSRGYLKKGEEADAVIHLIKLHGSLGWREYEQGRVVDTAAREYPEDYAVLAYPIRSDKSQERPFSELFTAFDDALAKANLIVIVGLSLRDDAIVGRVADALRTGKKLAAIIDPSPELVRNRLPQSVRQYVAALEGRFASDFLLDSIEAWAELVDKASRGSTQLQR